MIKCYAYTRVSTAKQGEGASLEAQRDAIERYAAQNNITISRWFEEKETAAKTGRPVFTNVIKELRRGRARGLVVHKIDRSARNFRDWAQIGDLSDLGLEIHFATESLDFNSRGGRLAADIQAVVAADYIRNLREEAKKGLNMRLQQGLYPFKAPLGYIDNGKGNAKTICPKRGPLVRTMFELYASGEHSLWSLPDEMNWRGLTSSCGGKMYKTSIEKILKNPFYTGIIRIQRTGKTYQGIHDPLISTTLFDAVQRVRANRDNQKKTKHSHLYRGLVKCASCKHSLIGEMQKTFVYYRCHTASCSAVSIREDVLGARIEAILQRLVLRSEHLEALKRDVADYLEEKRSATRVDDADFEISKIESRLDRLLDHRLDGDIDQDLFETKKARLLEDQQRWKTVKRSAEKLGANKELVHAFIEWSQRLPVVYQLAEKTEKRALAKMVTSNAELDQKKLKLEPSNWVLALESTAGVPVGEDAKSKARTCAEYLMEMWFTETDQLEPVKRAIYCSVDPDLGVVGS